MACPRVLITGFGPFPGAAENSSAWLAEALAAAGAPSGCTLHTEVLPTEWTEVAARGPLLLQQHRPRLILHLGLSRTAKGFRIERSAHNVIDFREDARGAMPKKRAVLASGDARLDTAISTAKLAKHLRTQDLPASASRSAGAYLCNYLYYLSLHWARVQEAPCDVTFVHIPPGPRAGGRLSEAELLRGADLILRYLLDIARDRDRRGALPARSRQLPLSRRDAHEA
jgi:pyroglutamyl-peptidase